MSRPTAARKAPKGEYIETVSSLLVQVFFFHPNASISQLLTVFYYLLVKVSILIFNFFPFFFLHARVL